MDRMDNSKVARPNSGRDELADAEADRALLIVLEAPFFTSCFMFFIL